MALQKRVKWLFTLVVLANLVIVLIVVLGAFQPPPLKPLPNPNGYDNFIKAGNLLNGNAGDYSTMKEATLAALVATNAEALQLVRGGLNHECHVPNDYSTNFMTRYLNELPAQKKLALNLCAEGRLATLQHRTNDAAQSYLDAMSFGVRCSQGGIIISKLIGIACEALGNSGLQSLTEGVDAKSCRNIATTLQSLDEQENTLDEILQQESTFVHQTAKLRDRIAALLNYKQQQKSRSVFESKFKKNQLVRRQVMIEFAVRAYELEKGKPPADIANLIPDYIKVIPKDPTTGSNLSCRITAR